MKFPFSHPRLHRSTRASEASVLEAQLPRRANRTRRAGYPLAKLRNRQRGIDKLSRILDERFGIARMGVVGESRVMLGTRRELRGHLPRKRALQQWESCCRMRYGGRTLRAAISGEDIMDAVRSSSSTWPVIAQDSAALPRWTSEANRKQDALWADPRPSPPSPSSSSSTLGYKLPVCPLA